MSQSRLSWSSRDVMVADIRMRMRMRMVETLCRLGLNDDSKVNDFPGVKAVGANVVIQAPVISK